MLMDKYMNVCNVTPSMIGKPLSKLLLLTELQPHPLVMGD